MRILVLVQALDLLSHLVRHLVLFSRRFVRTTLVLFLTVLISHIDLDLCPALLGTILGTEFASISTTRRITVPVLGLFLPRLR